MNPRIIPCNIFTCVLLLMYLMRVEGSGCQACSEREEYRHYTKQNIKAEILRKLGLRTTPNVTIENIAHKGVIRSLISKLNYTSPKGMMSDQPISPEENDLFQPKQMTILPSRPRHLVSRQRTNWNILYYRLSDWVEEERDFLTSADLLLHLPPHPLTSVNVTLIVHNIGVDKMTGRATKSVAKEGTWKLRHKQGGIIKMNLSELVRKWLENRDENLGIVVRAKTNDGHEVQIPGMDSPMAPYLQLQFRKKKPHYRSKREANLQCTEELHYNVTQCCRWPLTIDFNEFGWDWVLYPKSYEANFCSGDCSLGVIPESPHSHLLQMNLHSTAGPCCAARQMSQISMLYLDEDNNVVLGILPGMKVEKCGCS